MRAADQNRGVADGLSYFEVGDDWFDLWKAYEALRDNDLDEKSITATERTGFTQTANSIYRHRLGKYDPPDVNAGAKMYRRAGAIMHHGALAEGRTGGGLPAVGDQAWGVSAG